MIYLIIKLFLPIVNGTKHHKKPPRQARFCIFTLMTRLETTIKVENKAGKKWYIPETRNIVQSICHNKRHFWDQTCRFLA